MPDRPVAPDDSVLSRWIRLEIHRMNAGIVAERKSLARLMGEERPAARTKDGGIHTFDKNVLATLGRVISEKLREKLLLPILFHADMEVSGSVSLTDPVALQALQELGELSLLRSMQDGRIWIARPIAYALTRKYPTVIQVAMG
jgi:uncharacterized protein (UPF0216 family)